MGLSALPVELLTEILKALPWRDVLHMRQTYKLLSEATKTRAVWAHLVQEHMSSKEVPPRLERPIDLYTSQELEHLVLRWKSAEIGWDKDDGRPATERSFHCEPPGLTHLIQGGRWFLVTQKSGEVTYYDLEAHTISGVQLIPAQFVPNRRVMNLHVAVDVDTSSPLLKFNMAISSKERAPIESHALYIWNVTAVLDESGHAVGLSASRLAELRHQHKLFALLDFSLHGPYVAFSCYIEGHSKDYVVVVRWDQGDKHPYRMRIVGIARNYNHVKVLLLPDTRVLLVSDTHLRLRDHSAVEESTDFIDSADIYRAVLWTKRFEFRGYLGPKSLHTVFCVENTAKILVSGYCLYAFSIHSLPHEPPPVHELFKYPDGSMQHVHALGASRGILYDDPDRKVTLMKYDVPTGDGLHLASPSFLYKNIFPKTSQDFDLLVFDEETGRVILTCPGATEGYIIDYADNGCKMKYCRFLPTF